MDFDPLIQRKRQRFEEIEREIAGAAHELEIGDGTVAMHHEPHFGLKR